MLPSKNYFLLSLLSLLLCCSSAWAQRFAVALDNPDFVAYPIAVTDLVDINGLESGGNTIGAKIGDVLRNDLEIGGFFAVISPKAYLAPKTELWTNPVYDAWFNVKASGLVRGAYNINGQNLKVTFRLYDVDARREWLVKNYEGTVDEFRSIAHRYADDLYVLFTGKRSVFSTKIAFVGAGSGKGSKNIYICDFDGNNMQSLIANGKINLLPAWSKDGQTLFFTSFLKDNPDLYRYDFKSGKVFPVVVGNGLTTGVDVSPDGTKIAFTSSRDGNREIYTANIDGSGLSRLTNHYGEDVSPRWSPDGKQIAFVSSRSGNPHIYLMNADGSGVRRLTFQGNYNTEPDWSPIPGGPIAFSARDERNMYDIFVVDPASGKITRLTQDEGHNNESPVFSPDGQHIVFTSNRGNNGTKLYIMNLDGTGQRLIQSKIKNIDTPAWSPIF